MTHDQLRICCHGRGRAKEVEQWQAWSKEREHYLQLQKDHEELKKRWQTLEYVVMGMQRGKGLEDADKQKQKQSEDDYWFERSTLGGPWGHAGPQPL
jgi:hypothetical protein